MKQQQTPLAPQPRPPPQRAPVRRILVVDDSEDCREILARFLEMEGHRVRTATDGIDGLEAASRFRPEIVFVDLCMPRMDGFEFCEYLRADPATPDMAVFAVSGGAYRGSRLARASAEFDAYLAKPVECQVIEALVNCTSRTLQG